MLGLPGRSAIGGRGDDAVVCVVGTTDGPAMLAVDEVEPVAPGVLLGV